MTHTRLRAWWDRLPLLSSGNFQLLLLICTGLVTLFFVAEAVRFLPVTSDNIYPESAGVLVALHWVQGLPLYGDYRQPPYLATPFTPLWYGFLAIAAKAGLSDLDSLTLFGRLLSLVSLFGVAVLGYSWNRRLGLSRRLALLTPGFFLSLPILIPWAVTARPDFPAVFCAFLALYCAVYRPSTRAIVWAAFVSALAFLMKHNAVAVPVAVVLWLSWSKKWKDAGLFCGVWALVAGAALLPFQISSHGLLVLNLSGAKYGVFAVTYVRDVLVRLLAREGSGFAIALFAFGLYSFLQLRSETSARVRLISIYFVVSLGFAALGSASAGAAVNHYLEPALALAVLIPVGLTGLEQVWKADSPFALLAVMLTLALLLPSLDAQRWNAVHRRPENLQAFRKLLEKRVFTDDPYLAARVSQPEAVDLASLTNTERTVGWAAWSSASIAEALRQKKYDLVILRTPMTAPYVPYDPASLYPRSPRLDGDVQVAIGQSYSLCFESSISGGEGPLYVYSPVSSDSRSSASGCPTLDGSATGAARAGVSHR